MKPTNEQLASAATQLSLMKYFPAGDAQRTLIAALLGRLASNKQQLDWLVSALLNHVPEWPGPMEVRGLFCTRYKPADGKEANCSLAGFTADEIEAGCAAECLPESSRPPEIAGSWQDRPRIGKPVSMAELLRLTGGPNLAE